MIVCTRCGTALGSITAPDCAHHLVFVEDGVEATTGALVASLRQLFEEYARRADQAMVFGTNDPYEIRRIVHRERLAALRARPKRRQP